MPTAGRVGSSLGLKPYSSTSFLRSSSASFLAFRFLQQKSRAKIINATETTGTTTATAIVPPAESPLESLATSVDDGSGDASLVIVAEDAPFDDDASDGDGKEAVDVIITVVAPDGPPLVFVITDVTISSDVCDGGAGGVAVVEGASVVDGLLVVVVVEDAVGVGDVVGDSVSEVRLLAAVVMGTTTRKIATLAYGPRLRYLQHCPSFHRGENHTSRIPRHLELRFGN